VIQTGPLIGFSFSLICGMGVEVDGTGSVGGVG